MLIRMSASILMVALSAFSFNHDPGTTSIFLRFSMTKSRRIIDEWDTGVKRKISLSLKGIIDLDGEYGRT
jgi:hypothetical protein